MLTLIYLAIILYGFWQTLRCKSIWYSYYLFRDRYIHRLDAIEAELLMWFWAAMTATAGLLLTLGNLNLLPGFWAFT